MGIGTGGNAGIRRLPDGGLHARMGAHAGARLFGAEAPLYATITSLAVFACSAFAATAGFVLAALYLRGDYVEPDPFLSRLLFKTAFFALLAAASAWCAYRCAPAINLEREQPAAEPLATIRTRVLLFFAGALAMLLVFPNLGRYPWPAPDEMHHLIVARNLAEFGTYASGHPDGTLIHFDPYDSVGPPVLVPVAAAFSVSGTSIEAARILIALSYLLLCVFAYLLVRRRFGASAAAIGILLMTTAFGSVYLARSLYGEVPALMFLFAGLLLWRRAYSSSTSARFGVAAGVCFGMAALCKTFILIGAPAFLAVWIYDRLTWRRILFVPHVLLPALGLVGVLSSWTLVEAAFRDPGSEEQISTLVFYRHSLMFGLDSVTTLFSTMGLQILPLLAATAVALLLLPTVFAKRYDPAIAVLGLLLVLFAFWWVFFTPARIPRYLWYSCAITALFSGVYLQHFLVRLRQHRLSRGAIVLGCSIGVVVVAAGLIRLGEQSQLVYAVDRVAPERALAAYVETLPEDARIATVYWPAQRSINFLANRPIEVLYEGEDATAYDLIIYSERMSPIPVALNEATRFGHYLIVESEPFAEAHHD